MSDITTNSYLNSLTLSAQNNSTEESSEDKNELGQNAFLELMITQLENQSPLSPQDNSEFVAQLAQFSSVEGLDKLNKNFDDFTSSFMSNQALQASSLVGRSVTVPGKEAWLLESGVVSGSFDLSASSSNVSMNIYNAKGELVEDIPLGALESGETVFRWNGSRLEVNGELIDWEAESALEPGQYKFSVLASQDGKSEEIDTALSANVNSVTIDENNQLVLNLAGVGPVKINDVKQFN